jgi:hypothetical protein
VRTTLTLDDDVAAKLKAEMRKTGKPMKVVVNESLRRGLVKPRPAGVPFEVEARPLGRHPGVNYDSFVALLEEAEGPAHK